MFFVVFFSLLLFNYTALDGNLPVSPYQLMFWLVIKITFFLFFSFGAKINITIHFKPLKVELFELVHPSV